MMQVVFYKRNLFFIYVMYKYLSIIDSLMQPLPQQPLPLPRTNTGSWLWQPPTLACTRRKLGPLECMWGAQRSWRTEKVEVYVVPLIRMNEKVDWHNYLCTVSSLWAVLSPNPDPHPSLRLGDALPLEAVNEGRVLAMQVNTNRIYSWMFYKL